MSQIEAPEEESNLVRHARDELRRAGLYDADADYGGMLAAAVEELVRTFAAQGHSGYSAAMTVELFGRVARFEALTPITSDPDEWMEVGDGLWQSRRQPTLFSTDGGRTWHDVDNPTRRARFRRALRRAWLTLRPARRVRVRE